MNSRGNDDDVCVCHDTFAWMRAPRKLDVIRNIEKGSGTVQQQQQRRQSIYGPVCASSVPLRGNYDSRPNLTVSYCCWWWVLRSSGVRRKPPSIWYCIATIIYACQPVAELKYNISPSLLPAMLYTHNKAVFFPFHFKTRVPSPHPPPIILSPFPRYYFSLYARAYI